MIARIFQACLMFSLTAGIFLEAARYETYLESWDSQWQQAMTGLPPTPSTSPTSYNNVYLDIAFASYQFPGLNGVEFPNPSTDINTVISYVHSQNGKVKISYGGASGNQAGSPYAISNTSGWPNNIPSLVTNLQGVMNSYPFDGIDFDFEERPNIPAAEFAAQLFTFLTAVREKLPDAILSLTIPGQGWGAYWEILAKKVGDAARAGNSPVNYINFMEYDIWVANGQTYPGQIKADIETYTSSSDVTPPTNGLPGWDIPPKIVQLGLMPGNDDTGQYLSVDDAEALTRYAISSGLVGVMTWDINRDAGTRPIPPLGTAPYAYSNGIQNILNSTMIKDHSKYKRKFAIQVKTKGKARKIPLNFVRPEPFPPHGAH